MAVNSVRLVFLATGLFLGYCAVPHHNPASDHMFDLAKKRVEQQFYPSALRALYHAEIVRTRRWGMHSMNVVEVLNYRAEAFIGLELFANARTVFDKIQSKYDTRNRAYVYYHYKVDQSLYPKQVARTHYVKGLYYRALGKYKTALRYFKNSAQLYQKIYGATNHRTTRIHLEIASTRFERFELSLARTSLLEILQKTKSIAPDNEHKKILVRAYLLLARSYVTSNQRNRFGIAQRNITSAFKLLATINTPPAALRSQYHITYGDYYYYQKKYIEALKEYDKGRLSQVTTKPNSQVVSVSAPATLLTTIHIRNANTLRAMGKFPAAENQLRLASININTYFIPNHSLALELLRAQGRLSLARKDYKEALALFKELFKRHALYLPVDHITLVDLYFQIGLCHNSLKQHGMAEAYFRKAVEIALRNKYERRPELVELYTHLSILSSTLGRYEEALSLAKTALRLSKEWYGTEADNTGMAWSNVGTVYLKTKRYKSSIKHFDRAIAILSKHYKATHPRLRNIIAKHKNANRLLQQPRK